MKKLSTFLLFIMITCVAHSQYFELTTQGFVSANDASKEYEILHFPGKTKQDIYHASLVYLNKQYKSPKTTISSVENEVITILAVQRKSIKQSFLYTFDNTYTIVISFKDERIKIDRPICKMTTIADMKYKELHLQCAPDITGKKLSIYNKKGKVKSKTAVKDLNDFANGFVAALKEAIENEDEW